MFGMSRGRPPKPPPRWDEFKAWLILELTDGERLYIARWLKRWMKPDGKIPHRTNFVGRPVAPSIFDDP